MTRAQQPETAGVRGSQALGSPWQAGETCLSGLSVQARRARLGVPAPTSGEVSARAGQRDRLADVARGAVGQPVVAGTAPAATLPKCFDLRDVRGRDFVTPVRDQGDSGASVSFGVIAALETTAAYTRGVPGLNLDLAEAHHTGDQVGAVFAAAAREGVTFEDYFPYGAAEPDPDWPDRAARPTGVTDLTGDPVAIKRHLFSYGAVAATMLVADDFFDYTGGVYTSDEPGTAGHCVALIGWDDPAGCWIAKNSWGTGWGEAGFCRIAYGDSHIESYPWPHASVMGCTDVRIRAWLPAQRALRLFATVNDATGWAYLENFGWGRVPGGRLAELGRAGGGPVRPHVTYDGHIDQLRL
jgi:hypothetical protein